MDGIDVIDLFDANGTHRAFERAIARSIDLLNQARLGVAAMMAGSPPWAAQGYLAHSTHAGAPLGLLGLSGTCLPSIGPVDLFFAPHGFARRAPLAPPVGWQPWPALAPIAPHARLAPELAARTAMLEAVSRAFGVMR